MIAFPEEACDNPIWWTTTARQMISQDVVMVAAKAVAVAAREGRFWDETVISSSSTSCVSGDPFVERAAINSPAADQHQSQVFE